MKREDAISKINDFAVKQLPFLFVTDFEGVNTAVLSMDEALENQVFFSCPGFSNVHPGPVNADPVNAANIPRYGSSNVHPGPVNADLVNAANIPRSGSSNVHPGPVSTAPFGFVPEPVPYETYREAFEKVSWHLKRGDTYLVNLTFATKLFTELSLHEIFERSRAPYKLLFAGHFTVFSPEPFITTSDGFIRSNPMKGTIDASLPDAAASLLSDSKEPYEHNTIVDLIRNDLAMISSPVIVERFRYLEKITTNRKDLLQMSSQICGKLPPDFLSHLGNDIFTLLPAGSVSGAPKEKTVQVIREAEADGRGFYTGVFGYFDGRDLSSAVMIRFIENADGVLRFRSGGGITALSDCESEYRELIDKVYVPLV